jgi:hypothetical protein
LEAAYLNLVSYIEHLCVIDEITAPIWLKSYLTNKIFFVRLWKMER